MPVILAQESTDRITGWLLFYASFCLGHPQLTLLDYILPLLCMIFFEKWRLFDLLLALCYH